MTMSKLHSSVEQRTVLEWISLWFLWSRQPPPWWVLLGAVAAGAAVFLLYTASPWGAAAAVLYQVLGAALALAQFVGLQQGLNPGWLTRELRQWWAARPKKPVTVRGGLEAVEEGDRLTANVDVTDPRTEPTEEQLRLIWKKLSEYASQLHQHGEDIKQQREDFDKQLGVVHKQAQASSKDAEQRLSQAITSAPLQAAVGFWLILLGLGMQLWLAVAALQRVAPVTLP